MNINSDFCRRKGWWKKAKKSCSVLRVKRRQLQRDAVYAGCLVRGRFQREMYRLVANCMFQAVACTWLRALETWWNVKFLKILVRLCNWRLSILVDNFQVSVKGNHHYRSSWMMKMERAMVKWRNPMPRRPYRSRGTPLGVVIFNEVWWCFRSWLLKLLLPSRMWLRSANRCCSLQATMWVGPRYTGQGEELPRTFSSFPGFAARLANEVDKMGMTFLLTQAKTEWALNSLDREPRFPGVG